MQAAALLECFERLLQRSVWDRGSRVSSAFFNQFGQFLKVGPVGGRQTSCGSSWHRTQHMDAHIVDRLAVQTTHLPLLCFTHCMQPGPALISLQAVDTEPGHMLAVTSFHCCPTSQELCELRDVKDIKKGDRAERCTPPSNPSQTLCQDLHSWIQTRASWVQMVTS